MLSKKAKYAINALLYIARHRQENRPVLASEIAEQENIPHKFLEAILLDLKNASMLKSRRGRNGGYFLNKEPEQINLAAVMRLFDGPIALLPCVSENYYDRCEECQNEQTCGIRRVFSEIRAATLAILQNNTLESILNKEQLLKQIM